MKRYIVDWT